MNARTALGIALLLPGISSAALYTAGHVDVFAVGYEGGELEPHSHSEGATIDGVFVADQELEPGELTTVVPQSTFDFVQSNGGRQAIAAWDLIGVAAGQSYWFLPQANGGPGGAAALGAPFAGVGAEELEPLDWSSPITLRLDAVSGPGHFSMWLDGFTPTFVFASSNGIDGADAFTIAAGEHEHYNWGFTESGSYEISITVSGTHATDGFKEASASYNFQVIPEPGVALLGLSSALLIFRRRREP